MVSYAHSKVPVNSKYDLHFQIVMYYVVGMVVRKVDSTIQRIVFFNYLQKGIKSNDTRNIELAREKKCLQLNIAEP